MKRLLILTVFFLSVFLSFGQEQKILLEGLVIDESKYAIPYAAIGIPSKYIGTASTEEGSFSLFALKSNLSDSLEVSSIGYKTLKIKVQDFLNLKKKELILKEDIVSLNEVSVLAPTQYVKLAVKNLKKTTITKSHQLNVLYRRFSVEDNKARFLVEHYVNVLDYGPAYGEFLGEDVVAGRKSADYRFLKKKINGHPINVIPRINPMRAGLKIKDYTWKKTGDTSYDGEDIIIVEGKSNKKKWQKIKLYIGMKTFGVYKIKSSVLNSIFIYKKDIDGKLHLSYHNRTRTGKIILTDTQKQILNTNANQVKESYKHEVFVIGVERNKKIVNSGNYIKQRVDIGDISVKYNANFWKNLSIPPETEFYKKSVKDIESIFGVPLNTQFQLVNK